MTDAGTNEAFDVMGQFTDTVAGDVRDPYPRLAEQRRTAPVDRMRVLGMDGTPADAYVVHCYDDVARVMRDNATFSSAAIRDLMGVVMGPYVLVGMDEPEHRRHRALVSLAFRHKTLLQWEDEVLTGIVHDLIDRFAGRGRAELVRELTFRFPVQAIAAILGLPASDHARFHDLAVAIVNVAARVERGLAASRSLREYLAVVLEERRRQPAGDLISDLAVAELDGERLDDEEIFSFLRLLLPAGAETTYRATGNLLFGLLSRPDQLDALRADRSLMAQAVEEAIRWESPLLITSRTAVRDTEVRGVEVPAGSQVIAHVGSANHDETRWDDAESYDLFRPPLPHISFGAGPHMCLGMHLARMEMGVAVGALLDRLPGVRLDPDGDDPHIHGELFRSPTSLPVLFG
ncbi:MAG: cytochrome P450 [Actinomycetota bacterium]|nr:cytochrome P450 [Actinomycetota bacterium]